MIRINDVEWIHIEVLIKALELKNNKVQADTTGHNWTVKGNLTEAYASYRVTDKSLFISVVNKPVAVTEAQIEGLILMELGRWTK